MMEITKSPRDGSRARSRTWCQLPLVLAAAVLTDSDGDGLEDELEQDMYPESTAFCQIGITHFLRALERRAPSRAAHEQEEPQGEP